MPTRSRGPDRGALDEVLRHRLRGLIRLASERHGGPVLLVAHSLGSVIALTALDGWAEETGAAGESPPPPVDLVTMGSPLAMVAQAYPHLFGQERSGGRGWRLRAARSWANLYTSLDGVGRRLADTAPGPREGPPPQD